MFPSKKTKQRGDIQICIPNIKFFKKIKWFSLCHIHIMTSLKNLIFILFYILHDLQVPLFSFNSVDTFIFWGGGDSLIPHVVF